MADARTDGVSDDAGTDVPGTTSRSGQAGKNSVKPLSVRDDSGATAPDPGLYRILVESVRDYAIFVLDPTGHVVTWNEGAKRIKGYEPSDIIGKHFSAFYPAEEVLSGKPDWELDVAAREGRFDVLGERGDHCLTRRLRSPGRICEGDAGSDRAKGG